MKISESVEGLKKQLLVLGFEDGLEQELLSAICFLPEAFVIKTRKLFGTDVVNFTLHFDDTGPDIYTCKFFDASLRKQMLFGDAGEFLEVCQELDEKMKRIQWDTLHDAKLFNPSLAGDIESIIKGLQGLCVNDTGRELAARLRFKHWCNTALEDKILIPATLRNKFEISQRFYFFDGEERITSLEAYRFLNNKWMEKQFQAKRNLSEPVDDEASSGGSATGLLNKIKLMPKKGRKKS